MAPHLAKAGDQTLLLDVRINGFPSGKVGEFTLRGAKLLSRRDELRDLGFKVADSFAAGDDDLIALSDLPGVTWRMDYATQTVFVTAKTSELLPTLLSPDAGATEGPVQSGTGVTINYDLSGSSSNGVRVASGLVGVTGFSPWGVLSTNLLGYVNGGPRGLGSNSLIRLDTTYSFSDPNALLRFRAGDFITTGPAWSRPIRMGGAQLTSDFSLRPDLVTFPLPSVSGVAAVPSTVDVLVNGNRLLSQQVKAGPFQIPQLPVVTGAGTVSMAVTNALGQQVNVELPFYASSSLLKPGLQTFSAAAGLVRNNWGLVSNDYHGFAGMGDYRRGLSNWLTVETSAEAGGRTVMGGAGFAVNLHNFAILNVAVAGSTGPGSAGKLLSAGLQRNGAVLSLGVSATMADSHFRDVAAANGDLVPRLQLNANAGLTLERWGSFGVAYSSLDRDAAPSPVPIVVPPGSTLATNEFAVDGVSYLQPAQHAHVLTLSYSVQVGIASVFATGYRDFAQAGSSGVLIGLTIPLGRRASASANVGRASGATTEQFQVQQSASRVGEWGYQAYVSHGPDLHEFAQGQYMSPWALVTAGVDHAGPQTSIRMEAQGALSYVDGGLFPSNTINDSFAVVDTNGLGKVRVLSENQVMGRTDSAGRLLVPDLRAFEINHLAIDPQDVPVDTTIGFTTLDVRPQDRTGVVVKFPVKVSHGALLRLVDAAGKPLPVGSAATLKTSGVAAPIGYDGEAYVVDLTAHNQLTVDLADGGRCAVAFEYTVVKGVIPTIGPLACGEVKP
jgi:outer membrane usher protein